MLDPLSSPAFSPKDASRRRALAFLGVGLCAGHAFAQGELPAGRVVTWVVPYPPGGTTDVLGRSIAQRLTQALGTQVIVDNKPGATGTIGAAFVARATPDGTTLLGTSIGPQAIAPHLMDKLPYDPIAGFEPVVIIGSVPHLLVVGSKQPFHKVADLVAAGKAKPGEVAFASGGTGTVLQMQAELLKQQTGASFTHVPYKGDTPAIQDTLSEQVQFMFAPVAAAMPHVRSGRLRALATTSAQRLAMLPDVPTMTEEGLNDFVVEQWQAVFAPAGTPTAVVQRLNQEINKVLADPEVTTLADKLGVTLVGGTPQQLGDLQKADSAKWAKVIKDGGIKAE